MVQTSQNIALNQRKPGSTIWTREIFWLILFYLWEEASQEDREMLLHA